MEISGGMTPRAGHHTETLTAEHHRPAEASMSEAMGRVLHGEHALFPAWLHVISVPVISSMTLEACWDEKAER